MIRVELINTAEDVDDAYKTLRNFCQKTNCFNCKYRQDTYETESCFKNFLKEEICTDE